MIKNILVYPRDKEALTQKSKEVTENYDDIELQELIRDLKDTLKATQTGVGISAIQIGVPKKVCIIKYNGNYITMINPVITKKRGDILFEEGCLSAPGAKKKVLRAQKVWCDYTDENGKRKTIDQGGLCSIIIQHELDHFDGWCEVFDNVEVEEV